MPDWPNGYLAQNSSTYCSVSQASGLAYGQYMSGTGGTSAVWPAANRAIYVPFIVNKQVTAFQIAFQVGTQSGNLDVGIYNEQGVRLVSSGSTAVAAPGLQAVNITDTTLTPALYFMAMCVDNVTAAFMRFSGISAIWLQAFGVQQQAVGVVTLPDPATFANPASAYVPQMIVTTNATV